MCCKLAGVLCVIGSGLYIGINIAVLMKKRVCELYELERVVNILKGEIKYHRSIIYEACESAACRCGQPFSSWLNELCDIIRDDREGLSENGSFMHLWDESLKKLYLISNLTKKDMELVRAVGRCMEYPDIDAQEQGFILECEHIHKCVSDGEKELNNKMKLSVILSVLGAILLVVILL